MKVRSLVWSLACLVALQSSSPAGTVRQDVVVTNRNGGSISVINAASHTVNTYSLPEDLLPSEPMYPGFIPGTNKLYVGDRGNNRVVVFNVRDYSVANTIPVGAGVFHLWADQTRGQVWVNNDVDKTISVIDTSADAVVTTFSTPADLNAAGGRPHDVILDPNGPYAYVTMVNLAGENDYVVKYSTETFAELDRAAVGKEPHVSLSAANNLLYVPTQNANEVRVLDRGTLDFVASIPVANAHGAGMSPDGQHFYTTNFAGGGTGGLQTIDTITNSVVDTDNTPFGSPHNVALTPDGSQLFLTHSGPTSSSVTYYKLAGDGRPSDPVLGASLNVGLNPFGITSFAVVPEPSSVALATILLATVVAPLRKRRRALAA